MSIFTATDKYTYIPFGRRERKEGHDCQIDVISAFVLNAN